MQKTFLIYFLPLILLFLFSCKKDSQRFSDEEAEEIKQGIAALASSIEDNPSNIQKLLNNYPLEKDLYDDFIEFYDNRDYSLAWVDLADVKPQGEALIAAVKKAYLHGLDTNSYNISNIKLMAEKLFPDSISKTPTAADYTQLDFSFTAAYLMYASHMLSGVINPEQTGSNWVAYPRKKAWADYLQQALEEERIAESIESLAPNRPQYSLLKEKLAAYRELAKKEETVEKIPEDIALEPGDSSNAVGVLKKRLHFWGDLPEAALEEDKVNVYGEALEEAIAAFQRRHGILEDGLVGPGTIAMLNVPVTNRIAQIRLSLERLRWLPESFGEHYIWINVPEYKLKVIKKDKVDLEMKVIVGKIMTETPIFSDTMEYIVFSPTWTVPKSISIKEMLPKIKEDEDYLEDNNLVLYENWSPDAKEVDPKDVKWRKIDSTNFNFKIVEKPGKGNALGSVKFMFPNNRAIYLHDTPTGHLFDQTERGFSHGCIRVEGPKRLAEYLLEENGENWDMEKITEYMNLDTPTTVTLTQKIPVHIVYHTAWVDQDNRIHFLQDIYNHDKTQGKAIIRKEEQLGTF